MSRNVYNNVTPFGLCTLKEQAAFRTMRDAGHTILVYDYDGEWSKTSATRFWLSKVYRIKEGEVK